jgi:hypothetical protein
VENGYLNNRGKWLIFTSENGLRYFMLQLGENGGDIRVLAQFKIAAIGYGTATAMAKTGLRPDFIPGNQTWALAGYANVKPDGCDVENPCNLGDASLRIICPRRAPELSHCKFIAHFV